MRFPTAIAAGPDGALWFVGDDGIAGRISTTGVVTAVPTGIDHLRDITAGGDGNLWISLGTTGVVRLTPAGVATLFQGPSWRSVTGMARDSGGAVWLSMDPLGEVAGSVARVSSDGSVETIVSGSRYGRLAVGPDGNLWVTDASNKQIVRVTPGGVATPFSTDTVFAQDIVTGADGAMWTTLGPGTSKGIGRMSMTGTFTTFPPEIAVPFDEPRLTSGPDGNLWMTSVRGVSRITTAGVLVDHKQPALQANAMDWAPNGDLWVADAVRGAITRRNPNGALTTFADPRLGGVQGMAADGEGKRWFTTTAPASVGNITADGVLTIITDARIKHPGRTRSAPNGDVWFTIESNSHLMRVTPAGVLTRVVVPNFVGARNLTPGPDGNLWFLTNGGALGKVTPDGVVTFAGFSIPGANDITLGPDGNFWVTAQAKYAGRADGVVRVSVAGQAKWFTAPGLDNAAGIATGPDGNLWVTTRWGGQFFRLAPTGDLRAFQLPGDPESHQWFAPEAVGPGELFFSERGEIKTIQVFDDPGREGLSFHSMVPKRLLDSRTTTGGWNGPLAAGPPRGLVVTGGSTAVPSGARAVVVNVTATGGSANSFLSVFPAGGAVPVTSNLNFAAGETIPTLVTARVGTGGEIALSNAVGSVDVVVDVVGWFDAEPGDRFNALVPERALDSRTATGGWSSPLAAGAPRSLAVRGVGGVPATAAAVVMNVTVTGASDGSFVTAYPSGSASVPLASNLNFGAGQTIPNLVMVKVGADGKVAFANAVGSVDVVADVVGWFDTTQGDYFRPVDPVRLLDSRSATGGWTGPLLAGEPRSLSLGVGGALPDDTTAVIGTATVTGGTDASFLTVYPFGPKLPGTSNLNFGGGQTIPNLVAVKLGDGGQLGFANAVGSTDVVFDLVGYFAPL